MMGDNKDPKPVTTTGHRPVETSALVARGPQFQKRSDSGQSRTGERPWCSHCNRAGHTREKCFKLHGYPGNTKNQRDTKALLSSNTSSSIENTLDVRLTKSQLEALHKILETSTAHGSLAIQGTEIGEDDWHC
ncbi:hypothetical protein HRI_003892200 [Hibiscus trionum]|uniref:Uncharacterized protein n=1 Tax=Hibiscus trionum TaxID=183268 RepID=A0A9W7MJP8_HIBTR|nr:hypothetical protein HRI_003892200 [Hibiscus trionum]